MKRGKEILVLSILFIIFLINSTIVESSIPCTYPNVGWQNITGTWGFNNNPDFGVVCNNGLNTYCHTYSSRGYSANNYACGGNTIATGKPFCKDIHGNNYTGLIHYPKDECSIDVGGKPRSAYDVSCRDGMMVALYVTPCSGAHCGNEINNEDKPTCTYGNNTWFQGYDALCDIGSGNDYVFVCQNGYLQRFCNQQPYGGLHDNEYNVCGYTPYTPCTPKSCSQLGAQCGNVDDGCGTPLNCGDCNYCTTNPAAIKISDQTTSFNNNDIYLSLDSRPGEGIGYYADSPTANKICGLKGYDGLSTSSSWTPQYNFYTSPGDNLMFKWNGNSFDNIPAASYNTGVDTVTCKKTVFCYPNCIGKRPIDLDGCGGTCSSCLIEKKCVVNKCTTDTSCLENQTIMKVNPSTKLGALWNQTGSLNTICFTEIFNKYYTEKKYHNCSGVNSILNLNNVIESRVSNSNGGFNIPVCYGNLSCRTLNSSISIGLVASYSFEGNGEDSSGLSNDGIVNNATLTTGKSGQSYKFSKSGDYVNLGKIIINVTNNQPATYSAWINIAGDNFLDPNNGIIMSNGPCTNKSGGSGQGIAIANNTIAMDIHNSCVLENGSLYFVSMPPPVGWIRPNFQEAVVSYKLKSNTWYYVVGVYNTTDVLLYVNGSLIGSSHRNFNLLGSTYDTSIGNDYGALNWNRFFNGTIDEVKIWNRALTSDEILNEYQGTNLYCNGDEKVTAKMSDFTNAFITKANETTYPILLCCKNNNQLVNEANWTNMKDEIINKADLKDSIKLIVIGQEIQNKNVNYTIYKEGAHWWNRDNVIIQTSTRGYQVWQAGLNSTGGYSPGNYYFTSKVEGDSLIKTSGTLVVSSIQNNSKPSIRIIKPIREKSFIINKTTGKTGLISFEQISSDEDDDLNVTWDFRDGNSSTFSNCITTGNCNTTHSYTLSGTKMVKATAQEMLRNGSASNLSRIYIYKKGLNIFAIIDSPPYNSTLGTIGTYLLNGSSSHVANCSFDFNECSAAASPKVCYNITDEITGETISCYKFAESNSPGFKFTWTIDGTVDNIHSSSAAFYYPFVTPIEHIINLKVNYTY